jgi:hypothetical protein
MREYFGNLYSSQLGNTRGMGKFLDTHDLPKPSQEDISHLNTISNEIEAVWKNQQRKAQDLIDSLLIFARPLKKNKYQCS